METLPNGSGRSGDGIHQPPEPAILPHNKGLEPPTNPMGSMAGQLQF